MSINFEFSDLEAFLAVAECGSFQAAATNLNSSQSAVTRRIQKLEANLGVKLFDRSTRHVHPTLASERFRLRAQALVDDAIETTHAVQDEARLAVAQRNAIVTVALIPSIVPNILPRAIQQFRQASHTARLSIIDRLAGDVSEAVADGVADFGVGYVPSDRIQVTFDPLVEDRFVLAIKADDPIRLRADIGWHEVPKSDLIIPAKGTGNRMLIDEAIASKRIKLDWQYEVRRTSTAVEMVKAGIGIAIVPASTLMNGEDREITAVPLSYPRVSRSLGILRRPAMEPSSPARTFEDAIRKSM